MDNARPIISIIVPMHNEGQNVSHFYRRVGPVLEETGYSFEILCINDGSQDDTLDQLLALHQRDPRVKVVDLSRNFGKEAAMTAGLDYCAGELVVPIDADLQDPPELIHEMLAKWREGYDVVYATRAQREGETLLKKLTASLFYRTIKRVSPLTIPADTGDFRLMSRQVVDALRSLREQHRFMKGLFSWVGFRQTSISYRREPRFAGKSSFNYWKLWNFAIEGITSFSILPLQVATYAGVLIAFLAIVFTLYLVTNTLLFGNPVPGYPSLMVAISFLGGAQLMTLGIIGEYIGRIYNETKHRPLYLIRESYGLPSQEPHLEGVVKHDLRMRVNRGESQESVVSPRDGAVNDLGCS